MGRGDPEPDAGAFEAAEAASALDLLLSDAALGVVRRFLPRPARSWCPPGPPCWPG
jgi:hypothetical protein